MPRGSPRFPPWAFRCTSKIIADVPALSHTRCRATVILFVSQPPAAAVRPAIASSTPRTTSGHPHETARTDRTRQPRIVSCSAPTALDKGRSEVARDPRVRDRTSDRDPPPPMSLYARDSTRACRIDSPRTSCGLSRAEPCTADTAPRRAAPDCAAGRCHGLGRACGRF